MDWNIRSWKQNFGLKMMVKSGIRRSFLIWNHTCPFRVATAQCKKNLRREAELARQVSRYLWRGSVDFKKKPRPFFIIIFKLENGNFKTRDFSPLIERVLAGVHNLLHLLGIVLTNLPKPVGVGQKPSCPLAPTALSSIDGNYKT